MKRFLFAAALVAVVGFGTSSRAQAQISYGYTVPVVGGVETTNVTYSPFGQQATTHFYSPFAGLSATQSYGSFATPWGARAYSTYYSPLTGSFGQNYSTNIYGAGSMSSYGYNPYTNMRYGTGYTTPNVYTAPYSGMNYGWLRRGR